MYDVRCTMYAFPNLKKFPGLQSCVHRTPNIVHGNIMLNHLLYIDPGSGSYLIQVIVAALLGAAFWIKMSWQRVKAFFMGRKFRKDTEVHEPDLKDKEDKKAGH